MLWKVGCLAGPDATQHSRLRDASALRKGDIETKAVCGSEATPTMQSMAPTAVEEWFDGQPPQRQHEWLAITPPTFRIPEGLAFTVPPEYREEWLMVTYLGFGDDAASWFPAGPLARLLIARRAQPERARRA
jgi:hypothetical protein